LSKPGRYSTNSLRVGPLGRAMMIKRPKLIFLIFHSSLMATSQRRQAEGQPGTGM
jgi:hypothetical protein